MSSLQQLSSNEMLFSRAAVRYTIVAGLPGLLSLLAYEASDALDLRVGQRLVHRHLHGGHRLGRARRRRSFPVEELHRRAMVDVHGRDVDAAADAAFHQIEVVWYVRAVLVVDVVAAFGNAWNGDPGHAAEHLVVDFRVPPRSFDVLGQPFEPRNANRGLYVGEFSAVVRGQRIQSPHAFPESFLWL